MFEFKVRGLSCWLAAEFYKGTNVKMELID